jgi:hypothetical protein
MGDRTTVKLVIRKADFLKYPTLFSENDEQEDGGQYGETKQPDLLVSLTYFDIDEAHLGFEDTLKQNRIPYNKSWGNGHGYTQGSEHYRILSDGLTETNRFVGVVRGAIDIDAAINAYQLGNITAFLVEQKNNSSIMSWDDQEIIMQCRATTEAALLTYEQAVLDNMISVMVSAQGHSAPRRIDVDIKKHAVSCLVNQGYLLDPADRHIITPYSLDASTPFTLRDDSMPKEGDVIGSMDNSLNLGISLHFDGYSDHCSQDSNGTPIYIEKYEGKLRVIVYADINQEDPTHVICLEGANINKRTAE